MKPPKIDATLDLSRHRTIPYIFPGVPLYTITKGGRSVAINIARDVGGYDHSLWEHDVDVAEVGVARDGRWLHVRVFGAESEVRSFRTRRELCVFLRGEMQFDPSALHLLFQMGTLHFDPVAPDSPRGYLVEDEKK